MSRLFQIIDKAKDLGSYPLANAAFAALADHALDNEEQLHFVWEYSQTKCREEDLYYDLLFISDGLREACIPAPLLKKPSAFRSICKNERERRSDEHRRELTAPFISGKVVEDLKSLRQQIETECTRDLVQKYLSESLYNSLYKDGQGQLSLGIEVLEQRLWDCIQQQQVLMEEEWKANNIPLYTFLRQQKLPANTTVTVTDDPLEHPCQRTYLSNWGHSNVSRHLKGGDVILGSPKQWNSGEKLAIPYVDVDVIYIRSHVTEEDLAKIFANGEFNITPTMEWWEVEAFSEANARKANEQEKSWNYRNQVIEKISGLFPDIKEPDQIETILKGWVRKCGDNFYIVDRYAGINLSLPPVVASDFPGWRDDAIQRLQLEMK
jgi:hypothetical protein